MENFPARSTQTGLVNKTDFHNKLITFNTKLSSNKTKYLEVLKKLNSLRTEDYSFFFKQKVFYK